MSRVKGFFGDSSRTAMGHSRSRSFSGHCDVVGSVQMKHCSTAVEVEKQGYTEIVELPKVGKGCFKVWVAQQ